MAGASRTTFSRAQQQTKPIDTNPATVVLAVGITERGPIGTKTQCRSFPEFEKVYGGPTANAADTYLEIKALFEEAGQKGAPLLEFSRVVHCTTASDPTTKTSAAGTLTLSTAAIAATSGAVQSNAGPFALDAGQTLVLSIDGGGNQTFTITATQPARTTANVGPYTLANGQTVQFAINGGPTKTLTLLSSMFGAIAAATAAEVVSAFNAFFLTNGLNALADVNAGAVRVTALQKGTGSIVNIVGGTAVGASPLLQFTTGALAGTGNVANAAAVTAAEWVTIMAGLTGAVASNVSGALKVTSSTTGITSSVQVQNTSTAASAMGFDNAVHTGIANGTQSTLRVDGKTDGAYSGALTIQIAAASNGNAANFNLYVLKSGVVVERFVNLSMVDTDPLYAETVINSGALGQTASDLIKVTDLDSTAPAPNDNPNVGTFGPLTGGNDGLSSLADADFTGGVSTNGRTGMRVLDVVDTISLLIAPGRATATTHNGLVNYCEGVRGGACFAILDTPASYTADQIVTHVVTTASLKGLSEMAAIYWPRIYVDNPNTSVFGKETTVLTGPSGSVAGLCCRLDQSKVGGAFEHPASQELGVLTTARGLETVEVQDDGKRGVVFDALINPIMVKRGTPIYVDGARTLKDTGPFPTVGESRGILFCQNQIAPLLDAKRNRNMRPKFYREIVGRVSDFMGALTKAECFASNVDAEAWFFDMGKALNTSTDQAARNANARLGVATTAPAEFINVQIAPFRPAAAAA